MKRLSSRWLAWWYFTIALGFALLAVNRAIIGEKFWLIALRVILALGFGTLSLMEFRAKDGRR
ncbi:MAG: hypothetical protein JOY62_02360 [Acidobacteriaceae bacterium]|nr:hypothetical protein [Acidobacteriaceae bacterium]MBV9778792.1 hypothetical protein [Acidobacteriaceae bacterium]